MNHGSEIYGIRRVVFEIGLCSTNRFVVAFAKGIVEIVDGDSTERSTELLYGVFWTRARD